jgi:chemotaxis protein MotA
MLIGMMFGGEGGLLTPKQVGNFWDPASVFITIGCTLFIIVASFPPSALKDIPKHFKVLMNTKGNNPLAIIDELVDLAQVARKNGLLALEERGNQQEDPFFKQCIMLIVDNNDADQAREIMMNDIEQSSARRGHVRSRKLRGSRLRHGGYAGRSDQHAEGHGRGERRRQSGSRHGYRPGHHPVWVRAGPYDFRAHRQPAPAAG